MNSAAAVVVYSVSLAYDMAGTEDMSKVVLSADREALAASDPVDSSSSS